MEQNEKKGKLFGVVSALDLLVIIIVIGAIAFGALYIKTGGFKKGERVTVYYTVLIEGADKGFNELMDKGDMLKDNIKGYYLGVIDEIVVEESKAWLINEEKRQFREQKMENEEVVYITIKADGLETDTTITAGDIEIRLGKVMYIEGKGYACKGYVYGVRKEPRGE